MIKAFLDNDGTHYLLNNIYDEINNLRSSVLDSDTINRLVSLANTALTKDDVTNVQNNLHVECGYIEAAAKYHYTTVTFVFKKPFKDDKYAAVAWFYTPSNVTSFWTKVTTTTATLSKSSATLGFVTSGASTSTENVMRCSGICASTDI